jgi:hypothetical protein
MGASKNESGSPPFAWGKILSRQTEWPDKVNNEYMLIYFGLDTSNLKSGKINLKCCIA